LAVENPKDHWRVRSTAEQYEAKRFGGWKGRLYRSLEERAILKALGVVGPGSCILDAACGTGRITSLLLRHEFTAVGSDISIPMMQVARRQLTNSGGHVTFSQCDVNFLPYRAASFDAVTCIGLLMHLDAHARVRALRELARVSRHHLVVQYGCLGVFLRVKTWITNRKAGNVQYPLIETEICADLERSGLRESARFWVLRPFSSSVVLLLTKGQVRG